jgi:PKD repeat protein
VKYLILTLFYCASVLNVYSQNVHRWYQDGKVVFQLKQSEKRPISESGTLTIEAFQFLKDVEVIFGIEKVVQLHPGINDKLLNRTYQVEFSEINKVAELVDYLSKLAPIKYAEKKELHESFLTPNDPYYINSFNSGQWALFQIDAPLAWDISTGSSDIVVAVTDNAINISHPDLVNKMVPGWDAVDNDNDPSPCGGNDGFHGSHVSGIVGAETNNNIGIASIGYNVSIMPVKIGDCNTGSLTSGYDGIIWAADNDADVINMSWGGGGSSAYGQNVCSYAWNLGTILIAAAGNDGTNQQFYPAAYDDVVAVASTTTGDAKSSFSQYGPWVSISAPGSSILSTDEGSSYQVTQGTSMASPLVAGLVGLMISHAPSASPQQVVDCLLNTAENIDGANSNYIGQLGAGRINAYQALLCMNQFTYALDVGVSSIQSPVGSVCSASVDPQIVLTNYGGNTIANVDIEYQIDAGTVSVLNWTGNLAQGQSTTITLPVQIPGAGSHTLTATSVNPNGAVDQNTSNNSETSSFTIVANGQIADLTIVTDCYGSEITWQIDEDGSGNTMASGGPYADVTGGATNVENVCLASGCYVFIINDSYGDGLYGSQWTCTVDGNYFMEDQTGANLFQMTAPNGDFGSQTSHNFCITSNLSLDAGLSGISFPSGTICNSSIDPVVQLNNYGSSTLTSVDIVYGYSGPNQTYSWTGSLIQGASVAVNLPNMAVTTGTYTFTAYTDLPNAAADLNLLNDQSDENFTLFTGSQSLPFNEDFESNTFNTNSWTITNPDNGITWEILTVAGSTPGDKAAKMDLYNYGNGFERDGMQTPPLDFSNYTNVSMTFDHAFRRYNASSADSLVLLVSADCGNTFDRIAGYAEDGTGSLATAYTNTAEFIPVVGDWCTGTVGADCFTIDLSAYDGQSSVVVRFESFNNGIAGNNLFIDNINIDGNQLNNPPVANYSANPNLCFGEDVNFTDNSAGSPTSWAWDFGDAVGTSNLENPTYNYFASGTYTVFLTVTNAYGSDTYSQTITVNSLPNVVASASLTNTCSGESLDLTASGASSYNWDNGAGNGVNVTVSPSSSVTYEVTGSSADGCINVDQVSIIVNPNPTISLSSSQNPSSCSVSDGIITIGSGGTGNLIWTGPLAGNANNITLPYAASGLGIGTYTFSFTDINGCVAQDIFATIIDTNPPAAPTIIQGNTINICQGQSVDLTSSYTFGNSWSTNEMSQTISVNVAGGYSVYYTDPSGCVSSETLVDVIENPVVVIGTSGNVSICLGDDATLTATGASSYAWSNGVGSGSSVTVSPIASTTYTVTGADGNGCENSGQVDVMVNPLPTVGAGADQTVCEGNQVIVSGTGASSYTWDNGVIDGVAFNAATTTTYNVTGADVNGCSNTDDILVTVTPSPAVVSIAAEDSVCVNWEDVALSGSPSGGVFSGNGVTDNRFYPPVAGVGSHDVVYSYTDPTTGCVGRDTLTIAVEECTGIVEVMNSNLTIYPNPTQDQITIDIKGYNGPVNVSVYDLQGRLLETTTNTKVSLKKHAKGIYVLKVSYGDITEMVRVVRE